MKVLVLCCFFALLCVSLCEDVVSEPGMGEPEMVGAGMGEAEVATEEEEQMDLQVEEPPTEDEIIYITPTPHGIVHLAEHFDDPDAFGKKWVMSDAKKDGADELIAKYDGKWAIEAPERDGLKGDTGLVLKSRAKHSAISCKLERPFHFTDTPLIVQYEVTMQNGQECGGAYIKLLTLDQKLDLRNFRDSTPYTIMFGPDKCGNDFKMHFIFRHRNPKNGTVTEKHCKRTGDKFDELFKDKKPHMLRLMVNPDSSYSIQMDKSVIAKGSLLEEFEPPVNPPPEVDDPNDKRPEDWDDREKIPDPEAVKPEDWDDDAPEKIPDPDAVMPDGWLEEESQMIHDPEAIRPADWDEEMDGDWEAPLIDNPKCEKPPGCGPWEAPMIPNKDYRGKWRPPMVDNPNYKGRWHPRRISNPDYFEDNSPYKMSSIGAVGFEIWSMSDGIIFDNVIVTDDLVVAEKWAQETFELKMQKVNRDSEGLFTRLLLYTNKHPWLWAVYVVVIGLPFVIFLSFCCGSAQDKDEAKRAKAKKTDEYTADDVPLEGSGKGGAKKVAVGGARKKELEQVEEQEEDVGKDGGEGEEEEEGEGSQEEEEEEEGEHGDAGAEKHKAEAESRQEPPVKGSGDAPSSPRRRRVRKE